MTSRAHLDDILVQWGERLFYSGSRIVRSAPAPRLDALRRSAAQVRMCIERTVARQSPQVVVKLAGGGRGMQAIAAHFRYISMDGRLAFEDDRGVVRCGGDALRDLVDQWRYGGSLIEDVGHRREAFNLMLSMPAGTDAPLLLVAAREFGQAELAGHRYVMVLHRHQAHPHVHLCVRAEAASGQRLRPYRADLHRWRETFADKLRGVGIEAQASPQASRGEIRRAEPLWRARANKDPSLELSAPRTKGGSACYDQRAQALTGWAHIMKALGDSDLETDRELARRIAAFVREMPFVQQQQQRGPKSRDMAQQRLPCPHQCFSEMKKVSEGPNQCR